MSRHRYSKLEAQIVLGCGMAIVLMAVLEVAITAIADHSTPTMTGLVFLCVGITFTAIGGEMLHQRARSGDSRSKRDDPAPGNPSR